MKANIIIQDFNYSGLKTFQWFLKIEFCTGEKKTFVLGQDVKFCSRVLMLSPGYIAREIGSNDLSYERTTKRLARLIIKELNLNAWKLRKLQTWELCAT
jgi:hypothetical protein